MRFVRLLHMRFAFSCRPVCRLVHLAPQSIGVNYWSFQFGIHFGFGVLRRPDKKGLV